MEKKKSLSLLKPYRLKVLLAPVLKIVEVICELVVPFLVSFIIDEALTSPSSEHYHDIQYILILGGAMLGLAIIGFAFTMITQYLASRVSSDFGYDLKKETYRKATSLSSKQIETFGRGKVLNLLGNDAFALQNGVQMFMRLLVRAPFLVVGSIIASFLMSPIAGAIVLGGLILCSLAIALVFYLTPKRYSALSHELDVLSALGEDGISGARAIRAFGKEKEEAASFSSRSEKYRKVALGIAKINAFINPLTFAFVNIAIMLILYFGSLGGGNNGLSVGNIVALISYLTQCLAAIIMFARLVTSISKALSSKRRLDSFLSLEPEIKEGKEKDKQISQGEELFRFEGVSLSFGGEEKALDDISFSLKKGERLGIIGGTGSGKSTLLSLMERFIDPSEGRLLYKGEDIKEYSFDAYRGDMALVSQKSQIFAGTIEDNLTLGRSDLSEDDLWDALKKSLAYEFVSRYEDGLKHKVKENGANLSGGQKQRLLIARAIASKRSVILLDDATSALDYKSDSLVRKNLFEDKEKTLVIVSQRATSIRNCDKIIVLDKGRIVGKGNHEELMKKCPIYKEIHDAQVKSK